MVLRTRYSALLVRDILPTPTLRDLTWAALFYAGYAAILTPAFGIVSAYGEDAAQLNNALGFFVICK